jgi:multicomponent Na+:H+ antiporter subunit C
VNVTLAATAALLVGIGSYLVMQRELSRIVIGLGILAHAGNVLFLSSGSPGLPPFVGSGSRREFSDPLPEALILTAIVISFAVTIFLLALAYRSWVLTRDDEVEDDVEDRRVATSPRTDEEVGDEAAAISEVIVEDER